MGVLRVGGWAEEWAGWCRNDMLCVFKTACGWAWCRWAEGHHTHRKASQTQYSICECLKGIYLCVALPAGDGQCADQGGQGTVQDHGSSGCLGHPAPAAVPQRHLPQGHLFQSGWAHHDHLQHGNCKGAAPGASGAGADSAAGAGYVGSCSGEGVGE